MYPPIGTHYIKTMRSSKIEHQSDALAATRKMYYCDGLAS